MFSKVGIKISSRTEKITLVHRFKEHFEFYGNWDNHFGIFEGCGTSMPFSNENTEAPSSSSDGGCC